MVTVNDGRAEFQVDDMSGAKSPRIIQEENEFLNLSDPIPGKGMKVTVYEWISDGPHDSTDTIATIMAIGDNFIFYLCRQLIQFELMYFILLKPRVQSSLCTLVYMFIHPDDQHGRAGARLNERLNQGDNSLVPSANQSRGPNYTGHSISLFGKNTLTRCFIVQIQSLIS
jgi:hypothetical protein